MVTIYKLYKFTFTDIKYPLVIHIFNSFGRTRKCKYMTVRPRLTRTCVMREIKVNGGRCPGGRGGKGVTLIKKEMEKIEMKR